VSDGLDALRAELSRAAERLGAPAGTEPLLERPRDPSFGDWATNLAMVLAKPLGRKPRDLAQQIVESIDRGAAGIATAEIAGPGFINFRLDAARVAQGLAALVAAGEQYGHTTSGAGRPVVVEFVSANPTGPLHVGHGRQAALGDAISSLLEWTGWKVSREFYYTDAGVQIEILLVPQRLDGEHAHRLEIIARRVRRIRLDVPLRDLGDVRAVIAALGNVERRAAELAHPRLRALREVLDLDAGVVVVELARDLPPRPLEQRRDRVAERGLSPVADV
jgi:arginyl-tRNA synthetase